MSPTEAMKFFNLSRDSVYRWLKKHKQTGVVLDEKRKPYKPRKIDPVILREAFEKNPDATLEEIAQQFNCWPQSIHKRYVKLGITRKKTTL